jgi:hypothetical protein
MIENKKLVAGFLELAVTLKAGGKKFKGVLQIGHSLQLFTMLRKFIISQPYFLFGLILNR